MFEAVSNNNIPNLCRSVVQGADVNWVNGSVGEQGFTAVHKVEKTKKNSVVS